MESLHVIVDSREQNPFEFADVGYNNVYVTRDTLYIGDYSIFGCQNEIAIERRNYSNQIKKLKENYENIENKYASATVKINKNIESVTEKLNYLRTTYKLEDYKFKTSQNNRIDEPKVEETGIEYNLEPEKKVGIVDKIKDKFTNKKEVNHIDNEYLNKLESIEKVSSQINLIEDI